MDEETREALAQIDRTMNQLRAELAETSAEVVTGLTEMRLDLGTLNQTLARVSVALLEHIEDHRRGRAS